MGSAALTGPAEPSGADEGACEQRLFGTVMVPFAEIQLADGTLVVHEEIGCGAPNSISYHSLTTQRGVTSQWPVAIQASSCAPLHWSGES